MAGASPAEAVDNFIVPLRRSLQCITDSVLVASHYAESEFRAPRAILFGAGEAPQITCRDDLVLDVAHYFEVVEADGEAGPYRCRTLGYSYDFRHPDGPSVLAFHWHPASRITRPHAHTHQYIAPVDLSKTHIPTGRVSLETVIRLAIEEFGAQPRRHDWDQVLRASDEAFNRWREW